MDTDSGLPGAPLTPSAVGTGTEDVMPLAAPGRGPELLAALHDVADLLDEVPGAVHQLGTEQEDELVAVLLRLHGRSAQVATLVAADALDRGVVSLSDAATTSQWITGHLTAQAAHGQRGGGVPVEPRTIRAMAAVADACQHRKNTVITQALRQGTCSVETARTALTQADKIAPVIPTADRDDILGWYLQIDPGLGCAGLTLLTRRIIARFAPEQLSRGDEKLERVETLSWGTTPTGLTRVVAELAPANATILQNAITATSAPKPAKPTNDSQDAVRDERSPGKRRVDALMDLVGAGARAATSEGVQAAAATVLLTMNLETLTHGSDGATTTTGDVLNAGAARRLACTADLIPAVLGGPSAPLDVGRRERLATKAIRAAVILRDRGCTFPGCDRPPGFCEIHHVTPWWAGGHTSLTDSALLCSRHHHTVHRQGYMAEVRPDGVHWDLTPGRMPGHHTAAA